MKNRIIILLVIVEFLFCTTKDGILKNQSSEYSSVYISEKNQLEADIYIDGIRTGLKTPAYISEIETGIHKFYLFYPGYRAEKEEIELDCKANGQYNLVFDMKKYPSSNLEFVSNVDSFRVLVNGNDFGIINKVEGLPEGHYEVSLIKGNYIFNKKIELTSGENVVVDAPLTLINFNLIEHFSNTSCPGCPQADSVLEEFFKKEHDYNFIHLNYHPSYPSNNDPMYTVCREDMDKRIKFYKYPPLPHFFINGEDLAIFDFADFEGGVLDLVKSHLNENAVSIEFDNIKNDKGKISGNIYVENFNKLSGDVRLLVFLVEKEVNFDEPPGNNGQKDFKDVVREIYPSADGVSASTITFEFNYNVGNSDNFYLVAFVQDFSTKKVFQSNFEQIPLYFKN